MRASYKKETAAAFWEWFEVERARRRLSLRAVEGAGGPRTGWLQRRMAEGLPPTANRARVIAAAFAIPVEEVMRRAGLLDQIDDSTGVLEITEIARALSEANLEVLRTVARALAQAESQTTRGEYYRVAAMNDWTPSLEDWEQKFEELTSEQREEWLRRMQERRGERRDGD